jgi:SnoaL-like domain
MPRFKKNAVSIQDVIESFHKALYYQDIEKILKLWLNESHVSYIDRHGKIFRGIDDIKQVFNTLQPHYPLQNTGAAIIPQPLYHEILDIHIHTLIGGVFVETIEAIKYNQQEEHAEYYIYVSYVMIQTHLGWLFLRVHVSNACSADISSKDLIHKNKPILQ